jgi:hypothetical protein
MRRLAMASLALLLAALAPAQAQQGNPIGLRLLVQPWTPIDDDDTAHVPIDERALVSDALAQGWAAERDAVHAGLVAFPSRPNLVPGLHFRDIRLDLPEPRLAVQRISGGGAQPLVLRVHLAMPGAGIELTSTLPGPSPSGTDPRCSARADLGLTFALTASDNPGGLLRAAVLPGPSPLTISGLLIDSQNLTCDVLVAAIHVAGFD